MRTRRLIVLGSTGSVGCQTIDVVEHLNAYADNQQSDVRYEVVGLAAGNNAETLGEQARKLGVKDVALAKGDAGRHLNAGGARVRLGRDAAERLVREVECDVVLASMVGYAGLPATMAAVQLGRDVALANKETLVAAGELVVAAAKQSGSRLLPVDSEHAGVWQAIASRHGAFPCEPPITAGDDVAKIILTASGGALREKTRDQTYNATIEDALAHPTWNMGAKVTIDSASLTNKALELVEAHWLFGVGAERLGVLVEPTSTVHAIVEFTDGNAVAQMGAADMRMPIQYALTFPSRAPGPWKRLKWSELPELRLSPPDVERFPAVRLGYEVIRTGGTAGAVFNAANERAVTAFLDEKIPFGRIGELVEQAIGEVGVSPITSFKDVAQADAAAREAVDAAVGAAV
jgi:1-deoxy-D-xylulose-5-phosphate reductoisomerase